jgi:hypothetical protein
MAAIISQQIWEFDEFVLVRDELQIIGLAHDDGAVAAFFSLEERF